MTTATFIIASLLVSQAQTPAKNGDAAQTQQPGQAQGQPAAQPQTQTQTQPQPQGQSQTQPLTPVPTQTQTIMATSVNGPKKDDKNQTPTSAPAAQKVEKLQIGPEFSGFVWPIFIFRYRPNALPKDQYNYGAKDTLIDFTLTQAVLPKVGYTVELVLSLGTVPVLTGASVVDQGDRCLGIM